MLREVEASCAWRSQQGASEKLELDEGLCALVSAPLLPCPPKSKGVYFFLSLEIHLFLSLPQIFSPFYIFAYSHFCVFPTLACSSLCGLSRDFLPQW